MTGLALQYTAAVTPSLSTDTLQFAFLLLFFAILTIERVFPACSGDIINSASLGAARFLCSAARSRVIYLKFSSAR